MEMSIAFSLDDVSRKFGRVTALDHLSLHVREGEIYGFLGRNGAGKTTTLKILIGILQPDSGGIDMFGQRIKRVSVELKQKIGYVSQEPAFYPWMTANDLGRFVGSLYPTWDTQEFERLLKLLDVPRNQRSMELSGGTKTKLSLALALASRPSLLLMDEPTTGLDPVARREFNDQLAELQRNNGTTVFFSSHLVGEVEQLAQRVGIIQAGRARYEGDIHTLRDSVRLIETQQEFVPGEGFERIRNNVYRAEPTHWNSAEWPEGAHIRTLSLEDIFLAFARTDGTSLP